MAKGDLRGVKGLNDGLAEISRDLGKVADKLLRLVPTEEWMQKVTAIHDMLSTADGMILGLKKRK